MRLTLFSAACWRANFLPCGFSATRFLIRKRKAAVTRSEEAEQVPIMAQPLGKFSHNCRHKIRSDFLLFTAAIDRLKARPYSLA